MAVLFNILITVGLIVAFFWSLATLGDIRQRQDELIKRLDKIDQALADLRPNRDSGA